jgi:peptide subunit release factor RF-3
MLDHAHNAKRCTFAIISHPDAGKTTMTEKLLGLDRSYVIQARLRPRTEITQNQIGCNSNKKEEFPSAHQS